MTALGHSNECRAVEAGAVRDYDVQPNLAEHLKNREYYFAPSPTNSLGQLWILPQDRGAFFGYSVALCAPGLVFASRWYAASH